MLVAVGLFVDPLRTHKARGHGVATDAEGPSLDGRGSSEVGQTCFGRGIRSLSATTSDVGGNRRDVDDGTPSTVSHTRHEHPHEVPRGGQVNIDHPVPVGWLEVEYGALDIDGSAVDEDVNRPQLGLGPG